MWVRVWTCDLPPYLAVPTLSATKKIATLLHLPLQPYQESGRVGAACLNVLAGNTKRNFAIKSSHGSSKSARFHHKVGPTIIPTIGLHHPLLRAPKKPPKDPKKGGKWWKADRAAVDETEALGAIEGLHGARGAHDGTFVASLFEFGVGRACLESSGSS